MRGRGRRGITTLGLAAVVAALLGVAVAPPSPALAAAGDAPSRPFGSHLVDPAPGAALPPGGAAAADADTAAAYARWKADYVVMGVLRCVLCAVCCVLCAVCCGK